MKAFTLHTVRKPDQIKTCESARKFKNRENPSAGAQGIDMWVE